MTGMGDVVCVGGGERDYIISWLGGVFCWGMFWCGMLCACGPDLEVTSECP